MASSARIDELKKKFDENPRRFFAPLANEYRKAGDLDQAIFICQEYLPQQPGHMSGHIVYGQALFEAREFDEARGVFEAALALDPENLIALRHLGDLARQAGDLKEARQWYQRVLEADPRNEEMAGVLASLRVTPTPPVVSIIEPASVPVSAAPPVLAAAPPDPPQPVAAEGATGDDQLLDLDELTIGGTPLSTDALEPDDRSTPDADAAQPEPPTLLGASSRMPETQDFDVSVDAAAGEHDPFGASPTEPPIELATDLDLGFTDDGLTADLAARMESAPLEGLHSFEAGILERPADVADSELETEPFFDVLGANASGSPAGSPAAESLETDSNEPAAADFGVSFLEVAEEATAQAPEAGEPASVSQSSDRRAPREPTPSAATELFVTETMAELYLQQGHLDSALDIYRKLHEQRPEDAALLQRLHAVEDQLFGAPVASLNETSETTDTGSLPGPSIREFLRGIVARRAESSDVRTQAGEASSEPQSGDTPGGSIDALFSGANASEIDAAAASALAEAFGADAFSATPPAGMVAQRSATDAPIDSALTTSTRPMTSPDGFSFDQFFAGEANVSPPPANPSSEASVPPRLEGTDDVAQFNAWLNGLKKT